MDFPDSFVGESSSEGEIFFFTANCPIGISDHMHVCIKKNGVFLFFSTCSSNIDTAIRLAMLNGYSPDTYPVFKKDGENLFKEVHTYINCNDVFEVSAEELGKYLKQGCIYRLNGHINEEGLVIIAKGVKASTVVERRIQDLFDSDK